jgi:hypothetical protein
MKYFALVGALNFQVRLCHALNVVFAELQGFSISGCSYIKKMCTVV